MVRSHKRYLFLILTIVIRIGTGVAQENLQKSYALRSPEYEALRTLYIEQGIALPFSSGPFTEAEIRLAMDRLDTASLSDSGGETFHWLRDRLEPTPVYEDEGGRIEFDVGAEFTIESYLHTDLDNRYWEYAWEDREPFARFPIEVWTGGFGYAISDMAFLKNIPDFSLYPTYDREKQFIFESDGDFDLETEEEDPWINLPININTMDIQFPHRAFISVGGDRWNVSLGRDVIDWGNGRTGNVYISDHVEWYDSLQFSTFWDKFKFSWMWVSLDGTLSDEEVEYERRLVGWDIDSGDGYDGAVDAHTDPGGNARAVYSHRADVEHKNLVAQRFEVRLWNRLGLAYTMGIVFGREDIELRHLNPVYDYHNLYTNTLDIGNAHRSYEFDLAVAPGWSLYGAISPDQWTSPLEPETDLASEPNAYVALLGVDHRRGVRNGYLRATVEGVYATPWMHIHNHPLTSITNRRYVIAHHGIGISQVWYDKPIGHYGGNDFSLVWIDVSYQRPGRYTYGVNLSWEGDGSVPIDALLESKTSEDLRGPLDENDAVMVAPTSGYNERYAVWKSAVTAYGEVFPQGIGRLNGARSDRTLRISSELSGQWTKNRLHRFNPWEFDLQWVLSTTIGW